MILALLLWHVLQSQCTRHHKIWHQFYTRYFVRLIVKLLSELLNKLIEIPILFGSNCVVINSEQDTMGILRRVKSEKELTEFQSGSAATLTAEYVNIFHQTVAENSVEVFCTEARCELDLGNEKHVRILWKVLRCNSLKIS
jgi:hypothetical protein